MSSRRKSNIQSNRSHVTSVLSSPKWTQQQDEKLKQAVLKHGTVWTLISQKYKFNRSINSLVKRWHGKLKDQINITNIQTNPSKNIQKQNNNHINSQHQQQNFNQKQKLDKTKQIQKHTNKNKSNTRKNSTHSYNNRGKTYKDQPEKNQSNKLQVQLVAQFQLNSSSKSIINSQSEERKKQKLKVKEIQKKQNKKQSKNNSNQIKLKNIEKIQVKVQLSPVQFIQQQEGSESFSNEKIQQYVYLHQWTLEQDLTLKNLILNQKILNWLQLSRKLKIRPLRQVKRRWQKKIYPSIIQTKKIGGCVKYSDQEDIILSRGVKIGLGIQELRKFLPSRTLYSLDARRRRTLRADQIQHNELRFWKKKMDLFKFVQKRHEHLQKPAIQESFYYRSQSE